MILEYAWFTYMFSLCSLQRFCSVVKELGSTQCYPVFCPRCYLERREEKNRSEMFHNTALYKIAGMALSCSCRMNCPAKPSAMFPRLFLVSCVGL